MPDNTTYLIAALEVGYEPLVEYFRDLAESLGIPDPLPDLPEPPEAGPGELPLSQLPPGVLYHRTAYIPLSSFPSILRPVGVDPANKTLGLTFIVRRAIYTEITDPGSPPSVPPTIVTSDRGLEAEIIRYCGPGDGWDVQTLADIITASIESYNIEADVQTVHNGIIQCPALPNGWVRVFPVHPTLIYAQWEPPVAVTGPPDPPLPPL